MAIDRQSLVSKLLRKVGMGKSTGITAMTTLTPTDVPVILPFAATNPDLMTIDATTYANGAIKFSIVDSNMVNYALNLSTAFIQGAQESGVAQWSVNVPYVQGALAAEIVGGISIVYQAIQPVAAGLDSPSGNPENWQVFTAGGGSSEGGNIVPIWNIDFEYNLNDIINYNGILYKSLTAVNVGNVPSSATIFWQPTTGNTLTVAVKGVSGPVVGGLVGSITTPEGFVRAKIIVTPSCGGGGGGGGASQESSSSGVNGGAGGAGGASGVCSVSVNNGGNLTPLMTNKSGGAGGGGGVNFGGVSSTGSGGGGGGGGISLNITNNGIGGAGGKGVPTLDNYAGTYGGGGGGGGGLGATPAKAVHNNGGNGTGPSSAGGVGGTGLGAGGGGGGNSGTTSGQGGGFGDIGGAGALGATGNSTTPGSFYGGGGGGWGGSAANASPTLRTGRGGGGRGKGINDASSSTAATSGNGIGGGGGGAGLGGGLGITANNSNGANGGNAIDSIGYIPKTIVIIDVSGGDTINYTLGNGATNGASGETPTGGFFGGSGGLCYSGDLTVIFYK